MKIRQPPGYKLYIHLLKTALNKLNSNFIKVIYSILFNKIKSNFQKRNPVFYLIEKYIDKPWDWKCLSLNPNITPDFIEKHIDKPWDLYSLARNPNILNITPDFVEKHIDKPWNWLLSNKP